MAARPVKTTPAAPADEIQTLPEGSQASCAVCWRAALVVVRGRNLCGSCGAFVLNGSEDFGPWLD